MPTDLMHAGQRRDTPRPRVRNSNIGSLALTAALVCLQLFGLAMLERLHAKPMSLELLPGHDAAICTDGADPPVPQAFYD